MVVTGAVAAEAVVDPVETGIAGDEVEAEIEIDEAEKEMRTEVADLKKKMKVWWHCPK